ncbi:MAG: ABC transporter ATP-binding protein [Spirochaetaceae bacterium]|nr:ABC transporter ATP-binding protein [Spirochaetaceae bacterium]
MIEICNVSAGYSNIPIIKNISFTIPDATTACILGKNGSGKSTLLKAIAHIIPYQGSVIINGENLFPKKQKERAKYISIMGTVRESLFPYTVRQTVLLARYSHSEKKLFAQPFCKTDYDVVDTLLKELQIEDLSDRLISSLSSGQLQKVLLARALAQECPVLLLDEPTSHLDLKAQIEIIELLKDIKEKYRLSIIAVVHDINLALQTADHVILLKDGCIIEHTHITELKCELLNTVYETDVQAYMKKNAEMWNQQQKNIRL